MAKRRKKKYRVCLRSVGNPDFGQDPCRPLYGVPSRWQDVDGLEEASRACRAYVEEYGLGGGNWAGGEVIDHSSGKTVARVSYNGRVWPPGKWHAGMTPLVG